MPIDYQAAFSPIYEIIAQLKELTAEVKAHGEWRRAIGLKQS